MRLPRLQCTVRKLMVVIVVAALACYAVLWTKHRAYCINRAAYFATQYKTVMPYTHGSWSGRLPRMSEHNLRSAEYDLKRFERDGPANEIQRRFAEQEGKEKLLELLRRVVERCQLMMATETASISFAQDLAAYYDRMRRHYESLAWSPSLAIYRRPGSSRGRRRRCRRRPTTHPHRGRRSGCGPGHGLLGDNDLAG